MNQSDDLILVTGATGKQGGGVARALLAQRRIRILTRNPDNPAAKALARLGAEIAVGDMSDKASLDAAMRAVTGVFSMQPVDGKFDGTEVRHSSAIVTAAIKAKVRHFVHTSVAAAERREKFIDWGKHRWDDNYWIDKWNAEESVRSSVLPSWTILRPAYVMSNFAQPTAAFAFPHLNEGKILTAFAPATRLDLIAPEDIGAFARAAFDNPTQFNRLHIPLAAESLTLSEIAAVLQAATGKPVAVTFLSAKAAVDAGLYPGWVRAQEWSNVEGYQVDIDALKSYGIPLTNFVKWANAHSADIVVGAPSTCS